MNGTISRLAAAARVAYDALRRPPVPWAGSASSLPVRFVPRTYPGVVCTAPAKTEVDAAASKGRHHVL
jgi:hypothetical protein